ncbi:ABC transporter permease [Paenibacillus barengoltzii]|jgi:ABC-2 type transport system permease protein|uniref:ABC transporter permease n=1 Tax=Paenibacillus barengoltzii TaxID=343517 RepID=UPI000A08BE56|nr:ABC transporter permease [Paenibacillus barengoltzii]MEC2346611.1 ABC transporter permease [Paenibacillus barengoltzii]SMF08375.1 ABC-2 type transport system permease protein [Paenibacillus barengoltzii]
MNTISIALKELKQEVRNRWTLVFMLAFPIVLILILGTALTNAFESTAQIGDIRVLVKDNGENPALTQAFQAFSQETAGMGLTFEQLAPGADAQKEVEADHYDEYVELSDQGVLLYLSGRDPIQGNVVQGMLTAFAQQYNAIMAIEKNAPGQAEGALAAGAANQREYIKETSIAADRQPGSIDYYAMAMTSMIALWSSLSASRLITGEIRQGTSMRLAASPVAKGEIFAGKVLGNMVTNLLCVILLILFSKFAFNAYWGEHPGAVMAVLSSEVIMAVSLGLAVSYVLKEAATQGVILIFTQVAAFLGGAYFPMGELGPLAAAANLSPVRWANVAITQIIYNNQISAMWPVVALNLSLGVVLLAAAAWMMRRKEGL